MDNLELEEDGLVVKKQLSMMDLQELIAEMAFD
jgi:hypothetical protein